MNSTSIFACFFFLSFTFLKSSSKKHQLSSDNLNEGSSWSVVLDPWQPLLDFDDQIFYRRRLKWFLKNLSAWSPVRWYTYLYKEISLPSSITETTIPRPVILFSQTPVTLISCPMNRKLSCNRSDKNVVTGKYSECRIQNLDTKYQSVVIINNYSMSAHWIWDGK